MLAAFEQAAFSRTDVVTRWNTPLELRVEGDNRDILRHQVQRELERITGIAGVIVRTDTVTAGKGGNFLVEIGLGRVKPEEPGRCTTRLRVRDGHIQEARLILHPAQTGLQPCLLTQLMHGFGFLGLVTSRESVLSERSGRCPGPPKDRLTTNDELRLRALYDRRLAIGEPRATALARLQEEILPSLMAAR